VDDEQRSEQACLSGCGRARSSGWKRRDGRCAATVRSWPCRSFWCLPPTLHPRARWWRAQDGRPLDVGPGAEGALSSTGTAPEIPNGPVDRRPRRLGSGSSCRPDCRRLGCSTPGGGRAPRGGDGLCLRGRRSLRAGTPAAESFRTMARQRPEPLSQLPEVRIGEHLLHNRDSRRCYSNRLTAGLWFRSPPGTRASRGLLLRSTKFE
jgi:hypothetical protein